MPATPTLCTFAAIVLAIIVPGCLFLAPATPADTRHGQDAFTATYGIEGGTMTLDLSRPVSIRDGWQVAREAYPLRITVDSSALSDRDSDSTWLWDPFTLTVFLDGEMRIARIDWPCGGSFTAEDCTTHRTVWWYAQGALAPFGIGLAGAGDDALVSYELRGEAVSVAVERRPVEGGVEYTIPSDAPMPDDPFANAAGRFFYESGRSYPSRFQIFRPVGGADMMIGRLQAVQEGELLPPIAAWPALPDVNARADRVPLLYEGADRDIFERGFSVSEALDVLMAHDTEADRLASDGCLRQASYAAFGPTLRVGRQAAPFQALQYATGEQDHFAFILVGGDGEGWTWQFERHPGPLGDSFDFDEPRRTQHPGFCQSLHATPRGQVNGNAFLDRVASLDLQHSGEPWAFSFARTPISWLPYSSKPSPEMFSMQFVPVETQESGLEIVVPYMVRMDVATGTWGMMDLHPREAAVN